MIETLEMQPVTSERFQTLVARWGAGIGPTSSLTEMAMHPAYQEMIGMGQAVVPFLLRELDTEPDHWFWALKSITGVDPVAEADRGHLRRMTEAWLAWGRSQGIEW